MQQFVEQHKILDKQATHHCRHLGYVQGLLDNGDFPRVINYSRNGRWLILANNEIVNALVLFACRAWDKGSDAVSMLKLAGNLPSEDELKLWHDERCKKLGVDSDSDWVAEKRNEYFIENRRVKRFPQIKELRSLRNEVIAHNLSLSSESDRPTINALLELSEATINLVGLAGYLVDRTANPHLDRIAKSRKSCLEFWSILPPLTDLEK